MKKQLMAQRLLRQPRFYRATVLDPFLVEHGVIDDGSLVRGEDEMNFSVGRLHRDRVSVIVRTFGHVAAPRPRLIPVGRERHRQGRAIVHAVVKDQEQIAAAQFNEIHGCIGVGEFLRNLDPPLPALAGIASRDATKSLNGPAGSADG